MVDRHNIILLFFLVQPVLLELIRVVAANHVTDLAFQFPDIIFLLID